MLAETLDLALPDVGFEAVPSISDASDEVALNIGPCEQLVGIEVLDAKELLGKRQLPPIILENVASAPA